MGVLRSRHRPVSRCRPDLQLDLPVAQVPQKKVLDWVLGSSHARFSASAFQICCILLNRIYGKTRSFKPTLGLVGRLLRFRWFAFEPCPNRLEGKDLHHLSALSLRGGKALRHPPDQAVRSVGCSAGGGGWVVP